MKLPALRLVCAAAALAASICLLSVPSFSADKPRPPDKSKTETGTPKRPLRRGERIVREALSYRGTRYRFGGTSRNGIDCSGLTMSVCRRWGLLLPRTSTAQFHRGTPVHCPDLKPGDLVFFKGTYKRGISHVGIYIGEGRFIHAAGRGKGVIVSSLNEPYYRRHLAGARRLPLERMNVPPPDASGGDDGQAAGAEGSAAAPGADSGAPRADGAEEPTRP